MDDMQKLEQMWREIGTLEQKAQALRSAAANIGKIEWCSTCHRKELFRPGQWPEGWSSHWDMECWSNTTWYFCPEHADDCPRDEQEHSSDESEPEGGSQEQVS